MSSEHQKALKEATVAELFAGRFKLAGRRNLAVFVGVVVLVILLWLRWSLWLQVVPVLIWFAAAGQHYHLKLIDHELVARKDEGRKDGTVF